MILENRFGIIYNRTATYDLSSIRQLKSQNKVCLKKAKIDGVKIIKIIADIGKSGSTMKNPGLREVIKLIENKKIQSLYVFSSDRLSRNTMNYHRIREIANNHKVRIVYPKSDRTIDNLVNVF